MSALSHEGIERHPFCIEAEGKNYPPFEQDWFERAAHERYCLNRVAAVMAEICPDCFGIVWGSAAGNAALKPIRRGKKVVLGKSPMAHCFCLDAAVRPSEMAAIHGLASIISDKVQPPTGTRA